MIVNREPTNIEILEKQLNKYGYRLKYYSPDFPIGGWYKIQKPIGKFLYPKLVEEVEN